MKIILLLISVFPICVFSQTPITTPSPTPLPNPQSSRTNTNPTAQRPREFEGLRRFEEESIVSEEIRRREEKIKLARRMIDELYRKPTKKEMLSVSIDSDLRDKFTDFLKHENTGLIRLLNTKICAENTDVVVASSDCLKSTMPGAGSSFSFRTNNYRIPRLADLMLTENAFITSGEWIHGILVNIGDVPLENVNLQTSGVEFLNNFQPIVELEAAKDINLKLIEGIKSGDFVYSRIIPASENQTYLLRSIAYRGKVRKSANGLSYNELDFDKRKDVLIAFRVLRKYSDASLTLLWKRLAVKDSPKIVLPPASPKDETIVVKNTN